MSDIQFVDNELLINGVSSKNVAKTLKDAGLKNTAIAEIIGGWFTGVTGAINPAAFQFVTDVETVDPNCAVTYQRGFSHSDWIDGESRVQAGMTPEELGFNARFHSIENEFDSIAGQFAKLGNCTAELRADLIGIVRELEAKITTLQNGIHETKPPPDRGPDILGPITVGPNKGLITKFGDQFEVIKYEPVNVPDLTGPRPGPDPEVISPGVIHPEKVVFTPKTVEPDDVIGMVKGLHKTLEQKGGVGDLFAGGKSPTVGDIRASQPLATLPTGESLGSVIATMPAETKFTDSNDAVSKITEHVINQLNKTQTKNVRNKVVTGENADRTGTSLVNSGVAVLGVDAEVATALGEAGIGTVSRLSGTSIKDIASALTGAGLNAEIAEDIFAKAALTKALRNFG